MNTNQLPLKKAPTEDFGKCLEAVRHLLVSSSGRHGFIPESITSSSKSCVPGSVFVAIKGAKGDGHLHIEEAISGGAAAVVYQDPDAAGTVERGDIPFCRVSDSRRAYSLLQEAFHGSPASKLRLVGITGTNGKTTCAYLLRSFLSCGSPCGLISTVEYSMPGWSADASRTTPSPELFQALLFNMLGKGCGHCVMEVSSHGLDQGRTGSAKFAGALFTNLSGDHLDYHGSMENYYQAKKKLFSDLLAPGAVAVVNTDDVYGRRIVSEAGGGSILSCGFEGKPDFRIGDFEGDAGGVRFSIESDWGRHRIESGLCGRYNAMNIAESFALAMRLGVEPEKMLEILGRGIRVPGRLESFPLRNGAVGFVDYAHTDDALEKVLSTLAAMRRGRIICVFGCGGDRDRSKRPRMGAAVAKFADVAIVTSDNPRSEDPLRIIRDIMDGVKDAGKFICIPDRREAIEKAVGISRDGDIVLLAGKGHEKGQEVNGLIIPFDDREEMQKHA